MSNNKNIEYPIIFSLTESQLNDLLNLYKEQWWSKHRTIHDTKTIVKEYFFKGNRKEIVNEAAIQALTILLEEIKK